MPPAPCSSGSTMIPASSCACVAARCRTSSAQVCDVGRSSTWRSVGEDLLGEHLGEHRVHPADGVAHAHAPERVAVVAAAHGQQPGALGPADAALVLEDHLDRHLDRDRAGVGEEDVVEPVGGDLDEPLGQPDRRRVGEPAEHHVRELAGLRGQRRVEHRVPVAVDRRPPRRHPVDDPRAVGRARARSRTRRSPAAPASARSSTCRGARGARGRTRAGPRAGWPVTAHAFAGTSVPAPRWRIAGSWPRSPSRNASSAPRITKPLSRIISMSALASWPSDVR